ncbi:MAG: orotate phosphoribosyltransferase [Flavobacteriales bacterium]|nr:orotate phosphoribosyltransferase [Flavobacteriales bacterium]
MDSQKDAALKVAEFLLQIKAIKLQPKDPFSWASGWKSPIYCDNRKTLSYPDVRTYIRQSLSELIEEEFGKPDAIAGVATGAIAIGALVAEQLGLPFCYVRSKAKGHGMENLIEGDVNPGSSLVVIEDLISTGKSSIMAANALKAAGYDVKGMAGIFTYGFPAARKSFEDEGIELRTLTNYQILIEQALKQEYVTESDLEALDQWREDPARWLQPA